MKQAKILKLTLHKQVVGYLIGLQDGTNRLHFADSFKFNTDRPTFSLVTKPDFPQVKKILENPWQTRHKLHPILSNLLPEGALRELIAANLKIHIDNEFEMLAYLGRDLPGALVAEPVTLAQIPRELSQQYQNIHITNFSEYSLQNKFSLAGVQMKFSMLEKSGRYTLTNHHQLGNWIVKVPSVKHIEVPLNEYTAMKLASLVGVEIPEIKLIDMKELDGLPPINLPKEQFAYAIKRFDRQENTRVHMEDFAQALVKYPHEKYHSANYQQIGKVIYQFSADALRDIQQFARRLLVNILLANGDAHLKNWSFIYPDIVSPQLSPAYDIVTTAAYFENEQELALNLGKTKKWYELNLETFSYWSQKTGVPWRAIKPHLLDVIEKTRTLWPEALQELPMNENHKVKLIQHWKKLHADFQIK